MYDGSGDFDMAYVEPATVWAPKASIRSVEVLYNRGQREWSIARVNWEEEERVGIRWNGADDAPGIGHPQARGNATWFILPREIESAVLGQIEELTNNGPGGLLEQYRDMASDTQHEAEAEEWSEGLIGDASAEG
jgi:hypothetical protein